MSGLFIALPALGLAILLGISLAVHNVKDAIRRDAALAARKAEKAKRNQKLKKTLWPDQ